jgi:uncharacterized protein YsxB (DUF464 family)
VITRENPFYGLTEDGVRYVISTGMYCELCDQLVLSREDNDLALFKTQGMCRSCRTNRDAACAVMSAAQVACVDEKERVLLIHAIQLIADHSVEEKKFTNRIAAELQQMALTRSLNQQAEARRIYGL